MPSDVDFNPVVWVSLASVAGLSLVSLGRPGLRSDLDEQVYTGGLTAVQQMLGGEVGGDTRRFVGGSHSNKTGRFTTKSGDKELIGQFLLISAQNITVAPALLDFYEELVITFAEEVMKTDLYDRAEREFTSFSISDVIDIFFESIKKTRKNHSLPLNEKLFSSALKQTVDESIHDYEYSTTLVKIAEEKGKFKEVSESIKKESGDLIAELAEDLLEFLASENPHSLVMLPKLKTIKKDILNFLNDEIKKLKVDDFLTQIISDFETNDLNNILEDYALHEVTKQNLTSRIETEVFHKFLREVPLLLLTDPRLSDFQNRIEALTTKINEQYDLAGTLTRIGSAILPKHPHEEKMLIPFLRNFCEHFSTGLTGTAWKYLQVVFKLASEISLVDITDILPSFRDQIPPSHFITLEKHMTRYKLTKIQPISFNVNQASDILPFYRALFSNLALGVNMILYNIALDKDNPNNLINWTIERFNDFSIMIHQMYFIFSVYSYLDSIKSKLDFTVDFPSKIEKINSFDIQTFLAALISVNIEYLPKEQQLIFKRIKDFEEAFNKKIAKIEDFLMKNPSDIAKGYSFPSNDSKLLQLSIGPAKGIRSCMDDGIQDYQKIIDKIIDEMKKIQDFAKDYLDGKIDEKKLNDVTVNHGFLRKGRDEFNKLIQDLEKNIEKKYKQLEGSVEKQILNLQKDITNQYTQACSFLNINRKNLLKKGKEFLPDSSKTVKRLNEKIYSIMAKEQLLTWDKIGNYYFYSKNRNLPSNLTKDLSSSLVGRKNFPLLKNALDNMTENPNLDIYSSYAQVLDIYAKNLVDSLFNGIGNSIANNYLQMAPDIRIVRLNGIVTPTLELGFLKNENAVKAIKNLLIDEIYVDSEKIDEEEVFRVSIIIPSFGCDYKEFQKVWKNKEWNLKQVLIFLSWNSLLNSNSFFVNLLQYSAGLYSNRVKESFEDILIQIEKRLIMN